jgi:hypothetical protein
MNIKFQAVMNPIVFLPAIWLTAGHALCEPDHGRQPMGIDSRHQPAAAATRTANTGRTTDQAVPDAGVTAAIPPPGVAQMARIESLPLLRRQVQVHYEGSIDKKGKNADWDWHLYEDKKTGEWVLMDARGPGCLWNFVVHHAVGHSDPVYRFYFDGNPQPGFEIRHSEFGAKAPFVAPLADKFLPPGNDLRKMDFQIVRSFCPMPFSKSLKITSSVKLQGNHSRSGGWDSTTGGGWGHAIWHSYPSAEGITTFSGREDYSALLNQWENCGDDPKPTAGNQSNPFYVELQGQSKRTVFSKNEQGSVAAIRLKVQPLNRECLAQLWIRITWDDEDVPAVEAPAGAFFGNEFAYNPVQTLMLGTLADGTLYSYWPMPFWRSANIELQNRGKHGSSLFIEGDVVFKPAASMAYREETTGHFRASAYQPMIARAMGMDSPVADIRGHGHMVGGLISSEISAPYGCEGDVRVYIDDCLTPSVESDGSESWASYGWGFNFPPQMNPASSYDGTGNPHWSMLRLLTGDFYPFRTSLRMTVEGGSGKGSVHPGEGWPDIRSGIIFWYGKPTPAMTLTDTLEVGELESEAAHDYQAPDSSPWQLTSAMEGELDHEPITAKGRTLSAASEFTVRIQPENHGVLLRRRSDQAHARQLAAVHVDGRKVVERNWLYADSNGNFRWVEDQFLIPAHYTSGKKSLRIRIEPIAVDSKPVWNESRYVAFSLHPVSEPGFKSKHHVDQD